jgi:hypothetical protein
VQIPAPLAVHLQSVGHGDDVKWADDEAGVLTQIDAHSVRVGRVGSGGGECQAAGFVAVFGNANLGHHEQASHEANARKLAIVEESGPRHAGLDLPHVRGAGQQDLAGLHLDRLSALGRVKDYLAAERVRDELNGQ